MLSEDTINEANCVLDKPLNFYGGYLMEMMYKKHEVLSQETVNHLLWVISSMKRDNEKLDYARKAAENMSVCNFDLA